MVNINTPEKVNLITPEKGVDVIATPAFEDDFFRKLSVQLQRFRVPLDHEASQSALSMAVRIRQRMPEVKEGQIYDQVALFIAFKVESVYTPISIKHLAHVTGLTIKELIYIERQTLSEIDYRLYAGALSKVDDE